MSLTDKVAQFEADSNLVNDWVNGPASGTGSTVTTDSGSLRTPAKLIADLDAEINVAGDGVLAGTVANAAAALVSKNAAGVSETNALASKVAAEAARDAAMVAAKTYTTTAAGIAATTNLQMFLVTTALPQSYSVYVNASGAASFLGIINIADSSKYKSDLAEDRILDIQDSTGESIAFMNVSDGHLYLSDLAGDSVQARLKQLLVSQHSDLLEVRDAAGNVIVTMDESGEVRLPNMDSDSVQSRLNQIKQSIGQDAFEIADSSGSTIAFFDVLGNLFLTNMSGLSVQERHSSDFNMLQSLISTGAKTLPLGTTTAPIVVRNASDANYASGRVYGGLPGICKTGTRLWATWAANKSISFFNGEEPGSFCVLAYSDDDGATWVEYLYLAPANSVTARTSDPVVCEKDGILYVYFFQSGDSKCFDGVLGNWMVSCKNPSANVNYLSFSAPVRLEYGLFTGSISNINETSYMAAAMYPASFATTYPTYFMPHGDGIFNGITIYRKNDRNLIPVSRIGFDDGNHDWIEPALVQCLDGSLLLMLRYSNGMFFKRSTDGGVTWSAKTAITAMTGIAATTNSKVSLTVANSGRLCLVWNDSASRTNLSIALSNDNGATWSNKLLIDNRADVSYPCICHSGDAIYLVWDRARTSAKEINYCKLSEAAIVSGTQTVSKSVINYR